MNEYSCVLIKRYLQKQVAGWVCPMGCCLLTPVLENLAAGMIKGNLFGFYHFIKQITLVPEKHCNTEKRKDKLLASSHNHY